MHAVVLDLQRRDAAALALAALEVDEEIRALRVDVAQLVQLGVVARRDDAAFAHQRRGLLGDRGGEARRPCRVDVQRRARGQRRDALAVEQRLDLRQRPQRFAQRGEFARPHARERDARRDALDVRRMAQHLLQRVARSRASAISCASASWRADEDGGVALRLREPLAQQTAAGRGDRAVEQRVQRRTLVAVQRRDDLQVAPRGRVERDVGVLRDDVERAHVRERGLLRGRRVAEQRAGGRHRERHVARAKAVEVPRAEVARQRARGRGRVELPGRQPLHRNARRRGQRVVVRQQQLGDVEPPEQRRGLGGRRLGQREASGSEVEPRGADTLALRELRDEQAVARGVEQVGIGQRAGRHDPRHAALDGALARRGIAELLDDHGRLAALHESREVGLDRVVRHAGHRDRRAGRLAARRQRDVEHPRRALGIVVEQLVEIAHPVEHELVRMRVLDGQVLAHHRGVLAQGDVVQARLRVGMHDRRARPGG